VTLPHVQVYYLIRHASETLLASGRPTGPVICFSVCEAAESNGCEIYDTVHVRQFLEYYFPTAELEIRHTADVQSVQELRVSRSCGEDAEGPVVTKKFCEQPQRYRCPAGLPPLELHVASAFL
jgi:hypothetical protein